MLNHSAGEITINEAVKAIVPVGVWVAVRQIRFDDESLLLPAERDSLKTNIPRRLRESGAVRAIARGLLKEVGLSQVPILRSLSGEPQWPDGVIGSMAHDDTFAIAVITKPQHFRAIGIDIEPAITLPDELLEMVVTDADRIAGMDENLIGRFAFAAKEAVYKASFPRDKIVLNYDDIAIDTEASSARTSADRSFQLLFCTRPSIVVLAMEPR